MTSPEIPALAQPRDKRYVDGHFKDASFRGQDLAGADFSRTDARAADFSDADLAGALFGATDLRGADLSRADLSGADLSTARLGLDTPVKLVLFGFALLVAAAAGVMVGAVAEWLREEFLDAGWYALAQGLSAALLLIVFLAGLIAGGLPLALRVFFVVLSILLMAGWLIGGIMGAYRLEVAAQLVGMILLVTAAIVAGLLGRVVAGTMGGAAIMIVALGAGVITGETGGGLGALLVSVMIVIAAKRGLADPDADRPIHRLAYRIARLRGTRFTAADLRGAALPESGLRNCDVTGALMDESGEADTPTAIEQPGSD
jgi:hypothetical protein